MRDDAATLDETMREMGERARLAARQLAVADPAAKGDALSRMAEEVERAADVGCASEGESVARLSSSGGRRPMTTSS